YRWCLTHRPSRRDIPQKIGRLARPSCNGGTGALPRLGLLTWRFPIQHKYKGFIWALPRWPAARRWVAVMLTVQSCITPLFNPLFRAWAKNIGVCRAFHPTPSNQLAAIFG